MEDEKNVVHENTESAEQVEKKSKKTRRNELSFSILETIKKAQIQNGLRQNDYLRYRHYSSRRLKRLRKSLKAVCGKKHYVISKMDAGLAQQARYLLLPLTAAERCWAYSMNLKDSPQHGKRTAYHILRRLVKATKYSNLLFEICKVRADEATTVEAEAYHKWMCGNVALETSNWEDAMSHFRRAKTIYDTLSRIGTNPNLNKLYVQRVEEIDPVLRFCVYNMSRERGGEIDEKELLSMEEDTGDLILKAKLEAAIEVNRKKQAQSMESVLWRGVPVPVSNEKIRLCVIEAESFVSKSLDKSIDHTKRMTIFDKIFISLNDALALLRSDILLVMSKSDQSSVVVLDQLKAFLTHKLVYQTIRRNRFMVDEFREKMKIQQSSTNTNSKNKYAEGRPISAHDIVNIYDLLSQNMHELKGLPGFENDKDERNAVELATLVYRGLRCYYMALSYYQAESWPEAVALFNRCVEYVPQAKALLSKCNQKLVSELVDTSLIAWLDESSKASISVPRAMSLLSIYKSQEEVENEFTKLSVSHKISQEKLIDRLEKSEISFEPPTITDFPPSLQTIPAKPVLFDLAYDFISFPDLSLRKPKKKKGFLGFFS
eukprot:c19115_g1_i1.p1 GENE.c19115_g1_i1~~c19115_g1_i1.p1  ORF type:complete len:602 (+),score=179.91 c19115_g1_i1:701-2506(+)